MTKVTRLTRCSLAALTIVGLTYTVALAQEGAEVKPKHTISEVMKGAHVAPEGGKSLLARVLAGEATPKEQHELLDLYISLAENKPPKGEPDSWNQKTRGVILGATKVVVGREGAVDELRRATNCAACHREHRPPAERS